MLQIFDKNTSVKIRKSRINLIYENKSQFNRNNRHIFNITRMTTSISSEARRNQTSILIRGRENPPKPDEQTDIRTDIIIYRVASLLIKIYVKVHSRTLKVLQFSYSF